MITKLFNLSKQLNEQKRSDFVAFGVVYPLCVWGILTILSCSWLALAIIIGLVVFCLVGEAFDEKKKEKMLKITLKVFKVWVWTMYILVFIHMLYIPCHWFFPENLPLQIASAAVGFLAGVITMYLIVRTYFKRMRSS